MEHSYIRMLWGYLPSYHRVAVPLVLTQYLSQVSRQRVMSLSISLKKAPEQTLNTRTTQIPIIIIINDVFHLRLSSAETDVFVFDYNITERKKHNIRHNYSSRQEEHW